MNNVLYSGYRLSNIESESVVIILKVILNDAVLYKDVDRSVTMPTALSSPSTSIPDIVRKPSTISLYFDVFIGH